MSRTWKIALLILAFNVVCALAACAVLFVWLPVLSTTSSRETTRLEWAQSDKRDGIYRIGNSKEMALGEWHRHSNKYGCNWKTYYEGFSPASATRGKHTLESGSDKTVLITDKTFQDYPKYFETRGCGTWHYGEE